MYCATSFLPALAFILGASATRPVQDCPLQGPSFPATFDFTKSKEFRNIKSTFSNGLEAEFSAGSLNKSGIAFTVDVFSTVTNSSVFSYYHVGDDVKDAVTGGELNDTTISRLGSVSKIYTTYAILATGGLKVFNDPITKYLPELSRNSSSSDPIAYVNWDEITVGALASQQGGTGGVPLESLSCVPDEGNCTIKAFLKNMRDQKLPTEPAFQSPLYSDGGFAVLGRVLERMKGVPYNDALKIALSKPLRLNSTSSMKPTGKNINALALPGGAEASSWGIDPQIAASTGGVYTSSADLRAVGLSILNSELLPSSSTRQWLKPRSHTSSMTFSVGAPWEIHRLALPVTAGSNRTRVLDLYTKLGGNTGYSSVLALSPEHGLGYSIMISGDTAIQARYVLRDLVGDVFLPAVEHAAADNAKTNFAGTFSTDALPGTNITLTVDEGHAGLGVKALNIMGQDSRANLTLQGPDPKVDKFAVRIYQTGITSPDPSVHVQYQIKGTTRYTYRAVYDYFENHGPSRGGKSMFMNECESWFSVGFYDSVDELILEVVDGRLESVVHPLFAGVVLTRAK